MTATKTDRIYAAIERVLSQAATSQTEAEALRVVRRAETLFFVASENLRDAKAQCECCRPCCECSCPETDADDALASARVLMNDIAWKQPPLYVKTTAKKLERQPWRKPVKRGQKR